ncbi:MAG: hypothetical protein ABWX73_00665 [Marmoricola sp.]
MPTADLATRGDPEAAPAGEGGAAGQIHHAVICAPQDQSGPWIHAALRRRGFPGLRLVTTEEIVYSTKLTHRLASGRVTTEVTLADGGVLGPHLRGVVNRVVAVPVAHLARTAEADRDYATSEIYALLTSILAGLPGVVLNPGGPRGLPGPWLRPAEWMALAGRVGLPGIGFRTTQPESQPPWPSHSVLVAGERVVQVGALGARSTLPTYVEAGCRALSRQVRAPLLGIDFVAAGDDWLFAGANPTPDLRAAGDEGADAVAALLAGGRSG